MLPTDTELLALLRRLPPPAREEAKIFLDFLAWRYQTQPQAPTDVIASLRGQATTDLTTDDILTLTRGDE